MTFYREFFIELGFYFNILVGGFFNLLELIKYLWGIDEFNINKSRILGIRKFWIDSNNVINMFDRCSPVAAAANESKYA